MTISPPFYTRHKVLLLALSGLFLGFQLATLVSPVPDLDEPSTVDYAVHQRFALRESILPSNLKHFANHFGGLWTGFTACLRLTMKVFGIGLWQARLFPVLAALGMFAFLAFFLGESVPVPQAILTLLAVGSSQGFFLLGHNIRPESMLMLVMVANFWWLWRGAGRVSGMAAGLAAGAMLAFHPAIVFLIGTLPVVAFFRSRRPAFCLQGLGYWAMGFVIGALWACYMWDVDGTVQFLRIAYGGHFPPAPLIKWKYHPWILFRHGLGNMVAPGRAGNAWHLFMFSSLFAATAWQQRRWRSLQEAEKYFQLINVVLMGVMCLSDAGGSLRYPIYAQPWLWLQFMWVLSKMVRSELIVDSTDLLIFTCINVTVIAVSHLTPILVGWLPVFLCLILARGFRSTSHRWMVAYILFLCVTSLEIPIQMGMAVLYQWNQSPWLLLILGLPPLLVLFLKPSLSNAGRFTLPTFFMAVYFIVVCVGDRLTQWSLIANDISRSFTGIMLERLGERAAHEPRVVGPELLWLYHPRTRLQAVEALTDTANRVRGFQPVAALQAYRPSLILWPASDVDTLFMQAAKMNKNQPLLEKGPMWRTSIGNFQEIRFIRP